MFVDLLQQILLSMIFSAILILNYVNISGELLNISYLVFQSAYFVKRESSSENL